jgi:predicted DNA-binding protein
MKAKRSPVKRRIGRPPAGARAGEKVKDYPQLSIRLPADVKAKLQALSVVAARPQWRVVIEAIECYLDQRTESERRMVDDLVRRARVRVGR